MGARVDTLTRACKCGCGQQFKPVRKDQLFYDREHKADFNKLIYEAGKIAMKNAVQVGNGNKMPTIQSIKEWARNNRIKKPINEADIKKKKTFNARNIEGSKPLKRMLKLFLRGGKHSTIALNNYLTVTCAPTMAAEINWNFNKRHDLPVEYHKYKGMEIVTSTKRIKNKTVWFYKLEREVV